MFRVVIFNHREIRASSHKSIQPTRGEPFLCALWVHCPLIRTCLELEAAQGNVEFCVDDDWEGLGLV
jgi:hypothetical protein